MAEYTGNYSFSVTKLSNDCSCYTEDHHKKELRMKWVESQDNLTYDTGLLFLVKDRNDLFSDEVHSKVICTLSNNACHLPYTIHDYELALFVSGFPKQKRCSVSNNIEPVVATRGYAADGTARHVYEFVSEHSGLGLFAGLTVHDTRGSWSNYPMHKFEEIACGAPLEVYPDFSEKFAFITEPQYMWGLQVQSPAFAPRRVVTFKDRDIIDIPMGPHFSIAGPGTRLAYFWAYFGASKKDY